MAANPNTMVWDDTSSSIYSTDKDDIFIETDTKPLIGRMDSTSAYSASSNVSKISTVYSEESIKALGYRPFEYWKPPKPSAKKRPPPPPPPRRTNPTAPINALQDFKPMPQAKLREMQMYTHATSVAAPPASPRVKDRYAAKMAERARRKRLAEQRRAGDQWPGWVPDEKVLGGMRSAQRAPSPPPPPGAVKRSATMTSTKRLSAVSERWTKPGTWRRRMWGVLVALGVLALIAAIIVVTILSRDNAPALNLPGRVLGTKAVEAEDLSALPSASPSIALSVAPRRLVARRFRA